MKLVTMAAIVLLLMTTGCSTPFLDEQNQLFWARQKGKITEEEYQSRLKQIKEDQPWGGIGGAKQEPPPPLHWNP